MSTIYLSYFGLDAAPFSIIPDHRALYMSQSHREAVAHLLYALNQSGGFVQLTGEVGTGKTTVSRYILSNLPEDVDVALLLNPAVNEQEMLQAVCDELQIKYLKKDGKNQLVSRLNDYLLDAHSRGRKTVLIIDEAQNLAREVLEQIRLLTNLETSTDKLLQIILIGQPELITTLQRHDLRQLSQRIIGRFKLLPLSRKETKLYIEHRLNLNGVERALFSGSAIALIHRLSGGIPRLINVLCDRALLGVFSQSKQKVNSSIVNQSAREVLDIKRNSSRDMAWWKVATGIVVGVGAYVLFNHFYLPERTDIAAVAIEKKYEKKVVDISQTSADDVIAPGLGEETESSVTADPPVKSAQESKSDPFDLTFRLGVPFRNEQN